MKVCPKCKMTVDEKSECPFCYTTITYEPICNSEKEKYVFNKYFVLYLLKQCWFTVLCWVFIILRLLLTKTELNYAHLSLLLYLLVSLLFAIFERQITKYIQWKYSKDYAAFKTQGVKIISGLLAVLFAIIMS
ncbi:MAG: hypothetical protein E7560_02990 [Ruminococcaceae bacterium]|nr:hypothetical protein [Oscillospiraceae bacterium]